MHVSMKLGRGQERSSTHSCGTAPLSALMGQVGRLRRLRGEFIVRLCRAAVAAVVVAACLGVAAPARAASFDTFNVNSAADDNDGACQQPPSGDCTLREAINA